MKYEVYRLWDATNFDGVGFVVGFIERQKEVEPGSQLTSLQGEFRDDLEKELLTGKVSFAFKRGECEQLRPGFDSRLGLEGVVNVKELAKKYNKPESEILDRYFHLSSSGRDKIFERYHGGLLLLDDIYDTEDRGKIGIIWHAGGELVVYNYNNGEVCYSTSPGLGARYGQCGKRDFLNVIKKIEKLNYEDIIGAIGYIRDYDYYHWEDD